MSSNVNFIFYLAFFVGGMIVGGGMQSSYDGALSELKRDKGPSKGSIRNLSDTPERNTVHIDDQGRPITKQQLLEPFVIPNLVGFSIATFLPGQTMLPPHKHETMHEIFYVVEGRGLFQINEKKHKVEPGVFLHIAPKELHGIWVPNSENEALKMVVTGVAVGEKKSR